MPNEIETLIEAFSEGKVEEKYDALRKLIAIRKHHAAAKDERFQIGIDSLLTTVGKASVPDLDRLLAVATLGRLASAVKRIRGAIYKSLQISFTEILPEPSLLVEPDDRSYIGFACEQLQPEWGIEYCARSAVLEETGEQSRVAFLRALLTMKPELDSALESLAKTAMSYIPATEDPGTSAAKRLKRLMAALKIAISEKAVEPGAEPGELLVQTCRAVFKGVPAPKKDESLFEAAEGIGALIHEMVRLSFSLSTEASTYSALKVIKSKLSSHTWERLATKSQTMAQVVKDISEAMLILARQGLTDESLAGELIIASGHTRYAKERMKKLAEIPGLANNVKNWLAEGKNEISTETGSGESQQLSDDSYFADLLVDSLRFQAMEDVIRQQILPEIELLNPQLGESVARLIQNGVAICDAIQTMARRKGLRIRGNPGDEEEYIPLEHEVIGDVGGIRRVRIIRPVVEQVRENGVAFVISKGVVEKINLRGAK